MIAWMLDPSPDAQSNSTYYLDIIASRISPAQSAAIKSVDKEAGRTNRWIHRAMQPFITTREGCRADPIKGRTQIWKGRPYISIVNEIQTMVRSCFEERGVKLFENCLAETAAKYLLIIPVHEANKFFTLKPQRPIGEQTSIDQLTIPRLTFWCPCFVDPNYREKWNEWQETSLNSDPTYASHHRQIQRLDGIAKDYDAQLRNPKLALYMGKSSGVYRKPLFNPAWIARDTDIGKMENAEAFTANLWQVLGLHESGEEEESTMI
jgi:hypothetical protein